MVIDSNTYPDVLLVRLSGSASWESVRDWLAELENVPAYREANDAIFDLSEVELSNLSQAEVRRIVQGLRGREGRGPTRVAYVVAGELGFGILRMFASLADMQVRRTRSVCRSTADALAWLQASPERTDA
ncbi:MAG: hypothetical protein EA417_04805 [Gammaproteobacteria bacterium]|nr:MAG: hypothetical protein EA417_04805 [Gammaproteobacteria bacterium]